MINNGIKFEIYKNTIFLSITSEIKFYSVKNMCWFFVCVRVCV